VVEARHWDAEPAQLSVSLLLTRLYVDNYSSGTVSIIDTSNNSVTNTIAVGGHPFGIVISPDGTQAYIANENGFVSVIDTANNSVERTINTDGSAVGIAISHDGNSPLCNPLRKQQYR
jgi:YVTN family beta-propeller protein